MRSHKKCWKNADSHFNKYTTMKKSALTYFDSSYMIATSIESFEVSAWIVWKIFTSEKRMWVCVGHSIYGISIVLAAALKEYLTTLFFQKFFWHLKMLLLNTWFQQLLPNFYLKTFNFTPVKVFIFVEL